MYFQSNREEIDMDLRDVLLMALNAQACSGCQFGRESLDDDVVKLFEDNGVDIDEVVKEVEENEDGHLDYF